MRGMRYWSKLLSTTCPSRTVISPHNAACSLDSLADLGGVDLLQAHGCQGLHVVQTVGASLAAPRTPNRLSRLQGPAPKYAICNRPPVIMIFLRKWFTWFGSPNRA